MKKYLSEKEIVKDLLGRMAKTDRESWQCVSTDDIRGAHHSTGKAIRNHYFLWDEENPYTQPVNGRKEYLSEKGIVTDPNHPDQVSMRIMGIVWHELNKKDNTMRVAKELVAINHVISALENAGYSVKMVHDHFPYGFYHEGKHDLLCTDSTTFTISLVEDGDALEAFVGRSNCSAKDQFNAREGAQIAFGRAMAFFSRAKGRDFIKKLVEDYEAYLIFTETGTLS